VTETTFHTLGLAEPLLRAIASEGYTQPSPIQQQAIPHLLTGRDLIGIAQTGTGKTAAFALPILQQLSRDSRKPQSKYPRALVIAPTRELALQIDAAMRAYGRNLRLKTALVFGGVGAGPQIRALREGVDIVVATPGRLLDHAEEGHIRLDRVEHLVLDEADRMFDMGFIRDIRRIVAKLPKARQSLLFSATMPTDVSKLATEVLRDPVRIEVAPQGRPVERIDQRVYFVDAARKRALLLRLLEDSALDRVIVFTRTKHGANRLERLLGATGIASEAIHGNKSQNARQRALESFRKGETRVLVATDIAARGLDIDGVSHVINYELPSEPESYVHRIGRTARAGAEGVAYSFCAPDERSNLRDIERLTRRPIAVVDTGPLPMLVREEARRADQSGDTGKAVPSRGGRQHAPRTQQAQSASVAGHRQGSPDANRERSRTRRRSRSRGTNGAVQAA
jgi:ATP-dependent RNA helicase RhlE